MKIVIEDPSHKRTNGLIRPAGKYTQVFCFRVSSGFAGEWKFKPPADLDRPCSLVIVTSTSSPSMPPKINECSMADLVKQV